MTFLADTRVLIDIARTHPASRRWWKRQDTRHLFTSTITVGEL
jgi:predicted nucleic acid-binding protein